MKRTLAVIVLAFGAVPAADAQTGATPPDIPVVVTTGEGVVKQAPDRAWVNISAESRARTPQEAQKLNAAAMTAVLNRLKGTGLPPDAIQTRAYDLQAEYDYANNRQTLRGYVARNSIEVRVDALEKLGEIIDLAVGAGATAVSGVRFDLQDRTNLERQALQRAVADARDRATAAAAGAGMKVERVLRIVESRIEDQPPPRPMMAMREMAVQQMPPTPVAPGEIEIRAVVTLTAVIR